MQLEIIENQWIDGRTAYREFIEAHPELGLKYNEQNYYCAAARWFPTLAQDNITRKARTGKTAPWICDRTRFEPALFRAITVSGVENEVTA